MIRQCLGEPESSARNPHRENRRAARPARRTPPHLPTVVRCAHPIDDAAAEFHVRGLGLDWSCLTWDGDLRYRGTGWTHHDFRGTAWNNIHDDSRQAYVRNAYRVLLTRARQGMAIFVPPGDSGDHTRLPAFYDATFNYLASLGLPVMS